MGLVYVMAVSVAKKLLINDSVFSNFSITKSKTKNTTLSTAIYMIEDLAIYKSKASIVI